jgi:uncharacterized protein YndB with AHSA1/START domain
VTAVSRSRILAGALIAAASFALPGATFAEVTAVGPGGFTSTHTHTLPIPPAQAWTLLTEGLPSWWDADHSYGGVADNLSLDAGPGGCLCERLDNGGWVEHLRVIYAAPGDTLRLAGALGPLVDMGLQGVMRWTLAPDDEGGTTFTSRYVVSGSLDGGFESLAPVVDAVNGGHFKRLERVARGQPAATTDP